MVEVKVETHMIKLHLLY